MSKHQKLNALNALTIVALIAFGLTMKKSLPEIMPTKFDENGTVLKQAPVLVSVFFLPIIATITLFVLTFFAKKNKNFWSKSHNQEAVTQTNLGILLWIACLYIGTFLNAVNFAAFFKYSYFSIGTGLFFLVSASAMKTIDQNMLYGIRLPTTLKNETNWKKTHELTSKIMLASGALLVVIGIVTKNAPLILSLVAVTFIAPTVYSFKLGTQKT